MPCEASAKQGGRRPRGELRREVQVEARTAMTARIRAPPGFKSPRPAFSVCSSASVFSVTGLSESSSAFSAPSRENVSVVPSLALISVH